MDKVTASVKKLAIGRSMTPSSAPAPNSTKANSPPWLMTRPSRRAGGVVQSPPSAEQIKDRGLEGDEAHDQREQLDGLADQHAEIDRHADGDEEHGEQQSFERRDVGFDLMAVFRNRR